MSRLTDLIAQAKGKDADLGRELEREFKALISVFFEKKLESF